MIPSLILVQSYRQRLLSGLNGFLVRLALGTEDVRRRQVVFDLVKSSQHGLPVGGYGRVAWGACLAEVGNEASSL